MIGEVPRCLTVKTAVYIMTPSTSSLEQPMKLVVEE